MTITVGDAAAKGEKELRTSYPVEEGLTGGTQKQTGRTTNLVAQGINGVKSIVASKDKVGLG